MQTMKKILLTGLLSAASVAAFGQGTLDIANIIKGTFVAPIFQPNPATPWQQQVGQPSGIAYSGATPTGTTMYGGAPVTTAYDMVFLYDLNGTAQAGSTGWTVGTITPFRSAANATATPAGGIVTIGGFAVPGTTGGDAIAFQFAAFYVDPTIAAWEAAHPGFSAAALYNEAFVNDFDYVSQNGYGTIIDNVVLGGTDAGGTLHAPQTTGDGLWTSFSLIAYVPEPSTFVLVGLGAAGLLLFRRRK